MTRTPLRKDRAARGPALVALCALALTSCGTEGPGRTDPAAPAAPSAVSRTPTAPVPDPADDPGLPPEQRAAELAFVQLVADVAEPCTEGLPAVPPPRGPDGPQPPTGHPPDLPLPESAPPSEAPWSFERARRETALGPVEKCTAPLHGKRIAQALDGAAARTPAEVEKALRGIGYDVDHRLDGPREANGKVEFTLDLRVMGSALCLAGSRDGTRTDLDPYGGSPEVRCPDVERRS
ncbi:hypothetical protein [Streptomyces sp. bgisy060]|uniref:hypothetical protein n=1 Tax=Streptomyces sp. bgisy060 TaxID=3413775 RepID=UPI003EBB8C5C